MKFSNQQIAVIGLGYVGLPLAIEFGKKFLTYGYDIKRKRILELNKCIDETKEIKKEEIKKSKKLFFTTDKEKLRKCDVYILTLPTPINKKNKPDLKGVIRATKEISKLVCKGNIIIYESTVYPGVTDELLIPIIEAVSKLKINKDFFVGYSPERINPGDDNYTIKKITKVVSGSNRKALRRVSNLYKSIIRAGVYEADSIKIAEAAKVIENTQRDVNIALVNEFALIFDKLGIDTSKVLKAASTKWNFLPFKPGLVGGHCVGVDPYYLTFKAQKHGYNPKVILSGRKVNDYMPTYIFNKILRESKKNKLNLQKSKILILGFSFKEDCTDVRNTRVFTIYKKFKKISKQVDIFDPIANVSETKKEYSIDLIKKPEERNYDIIIIAVAHKVFKKMKLSKISKFSRDNSIIFDVKNAFKTSRFLTI